MQYQEFNIPTTLALAPHLLVPPAFPVLSPKGHYNYTITCSNPQGMPFTTPLVRHQWFPCYPPIALPALYRSPLQHSYPSHAMCTISVMSGTPPSRSPPTHSPSPLATSPLYAPPPHVSYALLSPLTPLPCFYSLTHTLVVTCPLPQSA